MKKTFATSLLVLFSAAPAATQSFACKPCAGLRTDDPKVLARILQQNGGPGEDGVFTAAWEVELEASAAGTDTGDGGIASTLQKAGATPWLSLVFRTAPPLLANLDSLGAEIEEAARLARSAPEGSIYQILWRPPTSTSPKDGAAGEAPGLPTREYAFLFKRAAVALVGADETARVATLPIPLSAAAEKSRSRVDLRELYAEEVGAYVDAVVISPGSGGRDSLAATLSLISELDPGKPVITDATAFPAEPLEALAVAAREAAAGVAMTLFETSEATPEKVRALILLAREFAGDLSFDPYSSPETDGPPWAWSFVRGEDLGLRLIAAVPPEQLAEGELVIELPDPQLRRPARLDPETFEPIPLAGVRRTENGLEVRSARPGPVAVLRLERPSASELQGVPGLSEEVTVESERQMPVEEILRRLQAFEDAQRRKVDHYQAINTTHFRFRFGTGSQTFEATLAGPYFLRRDQPPDWAWRDFYVNGVRWKRKRIPEIPLVQPEKAAAVPLEIDLDKSYTYRLKGSEKVKDRDSWVVEFSPVDDGGEGKLYRGTVWVDRRTYARLKTRAVQLGLEGDVISNQETLEYSPVDEHGSPAEWGSQSYVLPLRRVSRQLLSVINSTVLVEGEALLTEVEINGEGFDDRLREVQSSEVTMVRDTDRGLRYLVPDEEGGRTVQEDFDTSRFFIVGGIFADDALDFPLPLGGVNYFSFDWKGTGNQVNAFFAGVLLNASIADPELLGSKFDAGADLFALGIPLSDTVFRGDEEIFGEEVESRSGSFSLKLGRPLGNYVKVRAEYGLTFRDFGITDNTDEDFVLPADHLTHSFLLGTRFSRSGFQIGLTGSHHRRSEWDPWGLPDNSDFDPDHRDYRRWGATASKNWYLPRFQKIGVEANFLDGSDLDRFSKYGFGQFGSARVHGYQSDKVRADSAWLGHLTYGFEIGELLRIDAIADVALATDESTGLDNETLAGLGIAGTFIGPWGTLINVDVGTPVAGPDDGFAAFVVFLKLFNK